MARSVPAGAGDPRQTRQRETPLADALDRQRINRLAHFDVPAHKSGRGNPELTEYLGARAMAMDVNSMKPLDNLGHPVSVIKDAQALAAEALIYESRGSLRDSHHQLHFSLKILHSSLCPATVLPSESTSATGMS